MFEVEKTFLTFFIKIFVGYHIIYVDYLDIYIVQLYFFCSEQFTLQNLGTPFYAPPPKKKKINW